MRLTPHEGIESELELVLTGGLLLLCVGVWGLGGPGFG